MTTSEKALLGCNDRFFLFTYLLKRRDGLHPWIYARAREVEEAPDGYLDLWSRFHYKSSLITFAGAIQELLIDPEITIGIFAVKNEVARPFLDQIMKELEWNEEIKSIYSDVLWASPKREAKGMWSADEGITVKRQSNPKERTVEAYGLIDAMPTGRHFRLLIYDDLVTEKMVTEDMIIKCTQRWELSTNLGSGEHTRRWHIGTRYHLGDTYGAILERRAVKPRIYPATDNGKRDGNPVFLSSEAWEKIKREQRSTLAAQMLQNPLEDSNSMFDPLMLRAYSMRPRTLNVYIMGDPSQGSRSKKSDRTAIAVIGVDTAKNKYLLDGFCHRMKESERWTALKNVYKRWHGAPGVQMVSVGWERYGMQADLQYFEEKMSEKDAPIFTITELSWTREGNESKKSRVGRLEPDFGGNSFYLPAKVWVPDATWQEKDARGAPMAYADGSPMVETGPRVCTWSVKPDTGEIVYKPIPLDKERANLPSETREEKLARQSGEPYRIIEPIRRRDESGNVYDVTRMFFEEFKLFPFSPHDDMIDAVSRVYDMEPEPPVIIGRQDLELPRYVD